VGINRIVRFWPTLPTAAPLAVRPVVVDLESDVIDIDSDGLDAFDSEAARDASDVPDEPFEAGTDHSPAARPTKSQAAARFAPAALVVVAGLMLTALWFYPGWGASPALPAALVIESTPAGADVIVAGRAAGKTPVALELAAGQYDVQLAGPGGVSRDLRVSLAAGASVVRHVEFAAAPIAAPPTGALHIQTTPTRLPVSVDGVDRGLSPLTLERITPGHHDVIVRSAQGPVRQTVTVLAGQTVSLVMSPPVEPAAVLPGWLTVKAPVTLQLREAGRLIGTTETDRLMLPAGDHEIEVVNDTLEYRTVRTVRVVPGKTTTETVELPMGSLSINALPWAEVWVDGERIGETPLANVPRRIGSHDLLFRHPQFGERRQTVMVTMRQPARVGMDMRSQ
jgi:hypothetical protein